MTAYVDTAKKPDLGLDIEEANEAPVSDLRIPVIKIAPSRIEPPVGKVRELMNRALLIRLAIALMAFWLPLFPCPSSAQQEKGKATAPAEQKPQVTYRIEFNVREVENGKRLNSRNYVIVAQDGEWGKIRVKNKVPNQSSDNSYSFSDVRMSIDCRPHARDDSATLDINVDFSSMAPAPGAAPGTPPVFLNERTEVTLVVTPGKPTLITSLDDASGNRNYEVEVTATKEK